MRFLFFLLLADAGKEGTWGLFREDNVYTFTCYKGIISAYGSSCI